MELTPTAGLGENNFLGESHFFVKKVSPGTTVNNGDLAEKSNKKRCFLVQSGSFAKLFNAKELMRHFRTANAEEPDTEHIGTYAQRIIGKTLQALEWYQAGHTDSWCFAS